MKNKIAKKIPLVLGFRPANVIIIFLIKVRVFEPFFTIKLCRWWDLNPQTLRRTHLKRVCLPVSPHRRCKYYMSAPPDTQDELASRRGWAISPSGLFKINTPTEQQHNTSFLNLK